MVGGCGVDCMGHCSTSALPVQAGARLASISMGSQAARACAGYAEGPPGSATIVGQGGRNLSRKGSSTAGLLDPCSPTEFVTLSTKWLLLCVYLEAGDTTCCANCQAQISLVRQVPPLELLISDGGGNHQGHSLQCSTVDSRTWVHD